MSMVVQIACDTRDCTNTIGTDGSRRATQHYARYTGWTITRTAAYCRACSATRSTP